MAEGNRVLAAYESNPRGTSGKNPINDETTVLQTMASVRESITTQDETQRQGKISGEKKVLLVGELGLRQREFLSCLCF